LPGGEPQNIQVAPALQAGGHRTLKIDIRFATHNRQQDRVVEVSVRLKQNLQDLDFSPANFA
jgi:hypothetical protein